ncbi:MAG: glycerate kinase [Bacteroides sp.]|nr:glycerate kinase [Bacteroides sp.]MCM1085575.1 glycerate kinase [Bacteroides sp.]
MQHVIIIPDSFKGTMRATEVCRIMRDCVSMRFPLCKTVCIPIADGGEGTVDAFLYAAANTDSPIKGERKTAHVQGPYGKTLLSVWGRIDDTAVIETASCAGLPLVADNPDPARTSTFGVGQLISEAMNADCRKIIVGLGGSCTNDGACGMASALGVRFLDAQGRAFVPVGNTLENICRIDTSGLDIRLNDIDLECLCDVDNPLSGTKGAAYVFAPQKGADADMVKHLDEGLRHLAEIVERDLAFSGAEEAGAGAAGGCGYGMKAFLGARLRPGIEVLLDFARFDRLLQNADCVFTGEGRLDSQSLHGKALSGIARHAKKAGVPVIALAGEVSANTDELKRMGISAAYAVNPGRSGMQEIKAHCREDLARCMQRVLENLS